MVGGEANTVGVEERGEIEARLAVELLPLDEGGHDGEIDAVGELRKHRMLRGEGVVLRAERITPLLGHLVGRARPTLDPVLRKHVVLGEAGDLAAGEAEGELVGITGDRVVRRLEPEAGQRPDGGAGRHRRQIARKVVQAGGLEAHADPLQAVVSGDKDAGKAAVGRHAADADILGAENLFHLPQRSFRISGTGLLALEELLQVGDALGDRIDRAKHAPFTGAIDGPEGDDEVLELEQRQAARRAEDVALRIDARRIGRTGEDDVVAIGIDEDVGDPLEPAHEHGIGRQRRLAGRGCLDRLCEASQRHLSQAISRCLRTAAGEGLATCGGELIKGTGLDIADNPAGVDRDAADGLTAEKLGLGRTGAGECQEDRHQRRHEPDRNAARNLLAGGGLPLAASPGRRLGASAKRWRGNEVGERCLALHGRPPAEKPVTGRHGGLTNGVIPPFAAIVDRWGFLLQTRLPRAKRGLWSVFVPHADRNRSEHARGSQIRID